MPRPPNKGMVGRRFGMIEVLEHVSAKPGEGSHYRCRCDCGVEVKVRGADRLIDGRRMSCGCSAPRKRKDAPKILPGLDVAGQRFGMLVARKRAITVDTRGQGAVWLFKCDCGTAALIRLKDVKNGNTASCGCMQPRGSEQQEVSRPWDKRNGVDEKTTSDSGSIALAPIASSA